MDPPRWRVGQSAALSRMLTTLRNTRELSENDEAVRRALVQLAVQCIVRAPGCKHRVAGPEPRERKQDQPTEHQRDAGLRQSDDRPGAGHHGVNDLELAPE